MNLELNKPIVFFDLETTGVNIAQDRIVEISTVKLNPDNSQETRTLRINPGVPIPAEATAIHGISDEDVKDSPAFKEVAGQFYDFMNGCDLAGYNIMRFDLPLLVEEMLRAGVTDFPGQDAKFVDAMTIFHHFEKRDLASALQFYCDKELTDAHSAEADTMATVDVLRAQVDKYGLGNDVTTLHELSSRGKEIIDYAGKFTRNENGDIVYTFGPQKGKKVTDELGFLNWMLGKDFTFDTKVKAKQIINGILL